MSTTEYGYVKFRRGSLEEFLALPIKEPDTLYFLYEEDDSVAELYLGDKKISGGSENETPSINNSVSLAQLKDVNLNSLQDGDILIYQDSDKQWVNESLTDVLDNYKPEIKMIDNDDGNNHLDLIDEQYSNQLPQHGDIIIIKDLIADNHYSYTGYIYSELMAENKWCAMSGNYNAENIYFTEDFICTENIGAIEIPQGENSVTIAAEGKNLKD